MKLADFITPLNQKDLQPIIDNPALLAVLPIVYGAWADAELTESELECIIPKTRMSSWLTEKEQDYVISWMNPHHHPSDEVLETWADLIRRIASKIPKSSKTSLAALGLEVVRIAGSEVYERVNADDLHEMEEVVGEMSEHMYLQLFSENSMPIDIGMIGRKAAFSPKAMNDFLDGDYAETRQRVMDIISQPPFEYTRELSKEDFREKVLEWCHVLAKEGIGSLAYPKKYGGSGNMGAYIAALETMSYFDLSLVIKFGVHFGLFGGSVSQLGTARHHEKYLDKIGKLELSGCFAMTELGHGSNVRNIETTATYDAKTDEIIIHTPFASARKDYIGNAAAHAQMATVFSQLSIDGVEYGVHAVLVPIRDKDGNTLDGVSIEDCGLKMGLNGVDNGRLWFNQVRVPRENLLNKFGDIDENGNYETAIENPSKRFFSMLGTLIGGRVGIPSSALSAAKTALTIAIKYGESRRQFGPDNEQETRLLDYKTHQKRLMPLLANAYALDFALKDLLAQYVEKINDEDKRDLEALAAGMKAFSTWNATKTIQECREACGGQGYLAVNRFAELKADTDVFMTFEGDNTVLMQLVAKSVLTEFKEEFDNDNTFGYIKFFMERIAVNLDEINPFSGRVTNQEVLRSSDFQLNAMKYRQRERQVHAATRLRSFAKKRENPYHAFIRCQNEMMDLAHAHVELTILEKFIAGVEDCKDETLRRPLKKLCSLYALQHIAKDAAWFMEAGFMEASQSKAIKRQVEKLCFEVRQISIDLVDAFQIPDSCLGAPIVVD